VPNFSIKSSLAHRSRQAVHISQIGSGRPMVRTRE
jgi:hypothetical protein